MQKKIESCFNCGKDTEENLYSFPVCQDCVSILGLMTDETIAKHNLNPSFRK
jgi:hypothetical protein